MNWEHCLVQVVADRAARITEVAECVPRHPDGDAAAQGLLDELRVEVVEVPVGDEHGVDAVQVGAGPEPARVEQEPRAPVVDRQAGVVDLRHSDRGRHPGRLRRPVRGGAARRRIVLPANRPGAPPGLGPGATLGLGPVRPGPGE